MQTLCSNFTNNVFFGRKKGVRGWQNVIAHQRARNASTRHRPFSGQTWYCVYPYGFRRTTGLMGITARYKTRTPATHMFNYRRRPIPEPRGDGERIASARNVWACKIIGPKADSAAAETKSHAYIHICVNTRTNICT